MPSIAKPKPPAPKGKGIAGAKIAGVPLPLVLGGVVLAVVVGLYFKHRASAATNAAGASSPTGMDSTGGAGSAGSAGAGQDVATPIEDLAQAIGGLIPFLGGGGAATIGDGSAGSPGTSTATQTTGSAVYVPPGYSLAFSDGGVSYFTNPNDPVVYQTSTGSPTGLAAYLPPAQKIEGVPAQTIPTPPPNAAIIPSVSPTPAKTPTKPTAGKATPA